MTDLYLALIRHAMRRSCRCGRMIWIEWNGQRFAEHLSKRRGWRLVDIVCGDEVL